MVSANVTTKKRPVSATLHTLDVRLASPPKEHVEKLSQLEIHFFDDRRMHVGSASVRENHAEIELALTRSRFVRAVLAPRGMPPAAASSSASLPSIAVEVTNLKELEFPAGWWQNFVLGHPVFYRGHVMKAVGSGTLPICEGIVEVYEVDKFSWIWKLPEFELLALRDELLAIIRGEKLIPLPIPTPDPGPLAAFANVLPRANLAKTPAVTMQAAGDVGGAKNVRALGDVELLQLASLQGLELRNALFLHRAELLPFLCLVPWPWYTLSKLGEVAIRADGTFFGFAGWWLPGQDQPDLYFRVRQMIEGTPHVVYAPKVGSSTWWNYAGQDVPILVIDPQAIAAHDPLIAHDDQIVFLGLGFDTTTDVATSPGLVQTGPDVGLYRYPNGKLGPYAAQLHVVLDVDLVGLEAAGVKWFRVSYRRGAQTMIGAESDWIPLATPLQRHYRHVVGGVVSYPTLSLVPSAGSLPGALASLAGVFRFPESGREYVVIDTVDRAFGVFDTNALIPTGGTAGDVADVYTLRVQVFDHAGNDVTASTPLLRISDRLLDGSYVTAPLAATKPFLFARIDGRPMAAEIRDVIEAGMTTTGTGCGFLVADPAADVEVSIKAYHPGGVGVATDPDRFLDRWNYVVSRGASATTMVNLSVSDANAGSPTSYYVLPAAGVPAQKVQDLLSGAPLTSDGQRRCTFGVALNVYTLTRDGYGVRHELDRYDTASFALIDRSTMH